MCYVSPYSDCTETGLTTGTDKRINKLVYAGGSRAFVSQAPRFANHAVEAPPETDWTITDATESTTRYVLVFGEDVFGFILLNFYVSVFLSH